MKYNPNFYKKKKVKEKENHVIHTYEIYIIFAQRLQYLLNVNIFCKN